MSDRWDAWKDSYDSWKLATPPEYEITADEEAEMEEEREREESERLKEDRELAEFEAWEARWPWRRWRIYWRVRRRWYRWQNWLRDSEVPF